MRFVEPAVYLIAETRINDEALRSALNELGGSIATGWLARTRPTVKSEGEYLVEVAGRICYKSFDIGLNPNVTKIRQDSGEYINNTLAKGDGSIFEHSTCTFAFINVSRVFTHELVRHRPGVAISQESLRYVRLNDMGLWLPKDMKDKHARIMRIVEGLEKDYKELEKSFDWERMPFGKKKITTSYIRRIAPEGLATNIIWTANHRTIRHVITMRTSEAAEVEIRYVFDKVAQIMKERYPLIYNDFVQSAELEDGTHSWKPRYVKA